MNSEVWNRLKKLCVVKMAAPKLIVGHPGSVLEEMLPTKRKIAHGGIGGGTRLTQHQRVVLGRQSKNA